MGDDLVVLQRLWVYTIQLLYMYNIGIAVMGIYCRISSHTRNYWMYRLGI